MVEIFVVNFAICINRKIVLINCGKLSYIILKVNSDETIKKLEAVSYCSTSKHTDRPLAAAQQKKTV